MLELKPPTTETTIGTILHKSEKEPRSIIISPRNNNNEKLKIGIYNSTVIERNSEKITFNDIKVGQNIKVAYRTGEVSIHSEGSSTEVIPYSAIKLEILTIDEFDSLSVKNESMSIRVILVKTKQDADLIYQKLETGENFSSLSTEYSTRPYNSNGGLVENVNPDDMMKELTEPLKNLEQGHYTETLKTDLGYFILFREK